MGTQGTESSGSSKQENEAWDIPGERPGFESFFRDGARKIDLVLVIKNTNDRDHEKLKIEFLLNIIDVGLELELETGTMAKYRHLIFVKVHTPDDLIKEYGRNFGIFKMFRSSHTEFINPNMTYEREWLDLMRVQYPGPENFSTAERSQITYSLLQKIQTGEADNKFGLNRLLAYKIVLDAYPLHDGPYFFVQNQRYYEPNGRQILFIGWTGYQNLFRRQPLHVIREYMGERVAFLFAFFQFYILAQPMFIALGSALSVAGSYDTENKEVIERHACTQAPGLAGHHDPESVTICSKCRNFHACPFRTVIKYCKEVMYKVNVLDNLNMAPCTPLVGICAIVVYHIWRRRESYLYWLWEVREGDTGNLVRTEHVVKDILHIDNTQAGAPYFLEEGAGVDTSSSSTDSNTSMMLRFFLSAACMFLSIFVMLPFLTELQYWILWSFYDLDSIKSEKQSHIDNIFALILVGMTNAIFILALEPVVDELAFRLAKAANHRTEDKHERAVVIKLFGLAFLFNFEYMFFMTHIKGHVTSSPLVESDFSVMFGWKMMNCGLLPCLEEAMVAIIFTNIAKYTFKSCYDTIRNVWENLDPGNHLIKAIPIWETDYCLIPLTDEVIMQKYKTLILQYTMILFHFSLVPLLPILFFIANIWTLRGWAENMVVRHRRPLMLKTTGLGFYNYVLCLLPYFGAAYISLASSINSSYFELSTYLRFIKARSWGYTKYISQTHNVFLNESKIGPMVKEALKAYKGSNDGFSENVPTAFVLPELFSNETSVYYYLTTRKVHFVLLSVVIVILVGLICNHVIPHRSPDVEENLAAEEAYVRHGFQEDRKHQMKVSTAPVPASASPLP